jgi:predicted TIM-barrel fold metal-dependent hydrolase
VILKKKDAVAKLEEAVVKYGARGLKIHPPFQALPAHDEHDEMIRLRFR